MFFYWSLRDSKSPQVSQDTSQYSSLTKQYGFFLWILILLVFLPNLYEPFQVNQLQLVSPSLSCSTGSLVLLQGQTIRLSFRFFLFPTKVVEMVVVVVVVWHYYYYYYWIVVLAVAAAVAFVVEDNITFSLYMTLW